MEAPPPLWRRAWIHAVGREFGPAIVLVLALPLLVAAWVASPASPWALHRADARVAAGDLDGAVEGYEQVRRWSALTDQRREATWRAASLSAGATAEPRRARRLYRAFLKDWPEDPRIASARVSLARLEWVDFGRPHRAARQFAWATRAAPESPEAAEWLHRSGEAWLEAGRGGGGRGARRPLGDQPRTESATRAAATETTTKVVAAEPRSPSNLGWEAMLLNWLEGGRNLVSDKGYHGMGNPGGRLGKVLGSRAISAQGTPRARSLDR